MDNSIIVGIVENFTMALLALPVLILGTWLSTKSWAFYPIVVAGVAWITYVISGPVGELWVNPQVATHIKVMAWTIPPIFFAVLNIGSIFTIQGARRQRDSKDIVKKELT